MGKALGGFFAGVVASGLAYMFVALSPRDSEVQVREMGASSRTELPISSDFSDALDSTSIANEAEGEDSSQAIAAETIELREAQLVAQLDEARRVVQTITQELRELRASRALAESPILYPMPLPSELAWVPENSERNHFHELIQRESRDTEWANRMESQLQVYLYERPGFIEAFGPPTITCRATRCEVTAANPSGSDGSLALGSVLRSDFPQKWSDRFRQEAGTFWFEENYRDGVASLYWNFERRPD